MAKLHLGAGNNIKSGYFNHDLIKHRSEIDYAFDLNLKEWPSEHDRRKNVWVKMIPIKK